MATGVFGREAELGAVEALLASARNGLAALVLVGNPGIGKTTVWRQGIADAASTRYRVLSCRATSAEARLSFTALGDLLAPVEAAPFDSLPQPQRRARGRAYRRGSLPRLGAHGAGDGQGDARQ